MITHHKSFTVYVLSWLICATFPTEKVSAEKISGDWKYFNDNKFDGCGDTRSSYPILHIDGEDESPSVVIWQHVSRWSKHTTDKYVVRYAVWQDGRFIWNSGAEAEVKYCESRLSLEQVEVFFASAKQLIQSDYDGRWFIAPMREVSSDPHIWSDYLDIVFPEQQFFVAIHKDDMAKLPDEITVYWNTVEKLFASLSAEFHPGTPLSSISFKTSGERPSRSMETLLSYLKEKKTKKYSKTELHSKRVKRMYRRKNNNKKNYQCCLCPKWRIQTID